jgi:hypothetical protein
VLTYVQYEKQDLIRRIRSRLEIAVRAGRINVKESGLLMKRYEEGLSGYTYLTDEAEDGVELSPAPQAQEPRAAAEPSPSTPAV